MTPGTMRPAAPMAAAPEVMVAEGATAVVVEIEGARKFTSENRRDKRFFNRACRGVSDADIVDYSPNDPGYEAYVETWSYPTNENSAHGLFVRGFGGDRSHVLDH